MLVGAHHVSRSASSGDFAPYVRPVAVRGAERATPYGNMPVGMGLQPVPRAPAPAPVPQPPQPPPLGPQELANPDRLPGLAAALGPLFDESLESTTYDGFLTAQVLAQREALIEREALQYARPKSGPTPKASPSDMSQGWLVGAPQVAAEHLLQETFGVGLVAQDTVGNSFSSSCSYGLDDRTDGSTGNLANDFGDAIGDAGLGDAGLGGQVVDRLEDSLQRSSHSRWRQVAKAGKGGKNKGARHEGGSASWKLGGESRGTDEKSVIGGKNLQEHRKGRGGDERWEDTLYKPSFLEDPWVELYAATASAAHLRAHLDGLATPPAPRAERHPPAAGGEAQPKPEEEPKPKALAEPSNMGPQVESKDPIPMKEHPKEEPKATSIYDFFNDDF